MLKVATLTRSLSVTVLLGVPNLLKLVIHGISVTLRDRLNRSVLAKRASVPSLGRLVGNSEVIASLRVACRRSAIAFHGFLSVGCCTNGRLRTEPICHERWQPFAMCGNGTQTPTAKLVWLFLDTNHIAEPADKPPASGQLTHCE